MSEYEIGRDLQELRWRVERLEAVPPGRLRAVGGSEVHRTLAGIDSQKAPIAWKQHKDVQLPPFVHSIFGLPHPIHADAAQSKTWGCSPEPLILFVNWDGGGTDEYYRFTGQSFSLIRFTDPNTGTTTATATYSAQLIASGKAQRGPSYVAGGGPGKLAFDVYVRNAAGGVLFNFASQPIWVDCHTNIPWLFTYQFNPGLYDLVAGATWQILGSQRVDHC